MIKKTIILVIVMFFTTSCYDYKEINKLTIVNGIGIDYKDRNYIVSFEVLENSNDKESISNEGRVISSSGSTIIDAIDKLTLSLEKEPYYAHLKILIISDEIANNHLEELFDYFLRNNQIRNIFALVISGNINPQDLLNEKNDYYKVSSERIKDIIDNNEYSDYISKNKYFKNIVSNYLSKKKNLVLSVIDKDEENLRISKLAGFDNHKIVTYLSSDEAKLLSIIENSKPNSNYKIPCDENKYITVNIYKSDSKIQVTKDKFNIDLKLDAEIISSDCSINFENNDVQNNLEDVLSENIKFDIDNLIKKLQTNNSDVIGITKKYYNRYRKRNNKYFKSSKYVIKLNTSINKKGLIFEIRNN